MGDSTGGRVHAARPLFITGCARSGTSMTAGVIATLGLEFGQTIGGNPHNPKGFYENRVVRERVLKKYIAGAGGHPDGQFDFPTPGRGNPQDLRRDTLKALGRANAYKDAKILLIWELWAQAFPDSLYVIARRNRKDIARSCLKTGFMSAYYTQEGWEKWAQHYIDCLERLKDHVDFIEVWPDGTADVFRPVAEFLGLDWNQEAVEGFVDPKLWNRR